MAGGAPAGPLQIANDVNIKNITEEIAERIPGSPQYTPPGHASKTGKRNKTPDGVLKHFRNHCTVQGSPAVDGDIDAVLQRANIQCDADARKRYGIKELDRLNFFP